MRIEKKSCSYLLCIVGVYCNMGLGAGLWLKRIGESLNTDFLEFSINKNDSDKLFVRALICVN